MQLSELFIWHLMHPGKPGSYWELEIECLPRHHIDWISDRERDAFIAALLAWEGKYLEQHRETE